MRWPSLLPPAYGTKEPVRLRRSIGLSIAAVFTGFAIAFSTMPTLAASKQSAAAKSILPRLVACDGTFAASNSSVGSDNSYRMYRSITAAGMVSARALAEQGTTYPTPQAAQMVNFLIVTDLVDMANVDDADYEADFRRGVATAKSLGKPAAVLAVKDCIETVRERAPGFASANNAARILQLYPGQAAARR